MADINTSKLRIGNNDLVLQDAAVRASMAPAYSASSTYAVGDIVLKDGQLYECNTAISTAEAWTAAHWTAVTVGGELSSLKEETTKILDSAYVTDTASGAIASFPDGADNVPVKDLKVNVEPVQDLHGYENPWPAGGGVNKLNDTPTGLDNCTYTNGVVVATADDTRSFSCVVQLYNNTTYVGAATKIDNEHFTFQKSSSFNAIRIGHSGATRDIKIIFNASNLVDGQDYIVTLTVVSSTNPISWKNMMVRESSVSDATYAPYSNICPISGHTQAVVTRTGKNLANENSGNNIVIGTARKGHTYTFSCANAGSIGANIKKNSNSGQTVGSASGTTNPFTITFTADEDFSVYLNGYSYTSGSTFVSLASNYQLELGSTATAYAPYQGQTYTIDLNGTRYGGTLDVGTGVLTVDMAMVDLGTLNWATQGNVSTYQAGIATMATPSDKIVCDSYKTVSASLAAANMPDKSIKTYGLSSGKYIIVKDTSYSTVADFKTALNGVQLCYELATPTTVQLTANDDITTVLGQNNIWSDAGDVEVEYRADTALYIKKLTGSTEDDMVADANIVSGQYFMVGNTLYKATANIASGGAITPNVNCTRKSLSEALNEINA